MPMKSHATKVKEANERAAKNAQLSTQQKYEKAIALWQSGTHGHLAKEIARLESQLERERHDAKIAKEAQAVAAEAENKRREANRIKALNEAKLKGKVIIPSKMVEARKR